ncbi:S1C family serine protease [Roseivirga sp. E12]|uniref:S1C family serine protease n=1 Tax=Roseivirga sp. E12 TaxID=2819237 RepID=UPI001ABC8957|nr:trypsin-like peptidase domain-containing protein [Roseivirga sp. E12]MBO3699029.1 trypsin-like peptidase domain-containing protein [Roseivirga sp. E12]
MKSKIVIVLIAFIGGIAGAFTYQKLSNTTTITEVVREIPTNFQQANYEPAERYEGASAALPVDFRLAAEKSVSSVVYIKNIQRSRRSMSFMEYFNRGRSGSNSGIAIGSGSGVIYSKDGYIITNHHVIEGADAIEVQHEKRTYTAKLVGTDPSMDIAVLKIDADNLPAIDLAPSRDVRVGDWVLAVGNPFNLTSTVTAGIVSAIGSDSKAIRENFPIKLYIQTDAAINPGNSGGALVNTEGELIGINTSIISRTGSYAGYGFAVPSDVVEKIVEDLKKYKVVQKAYTGAEVIEIDEKVAQEEKLRNLDGVLIQSIRRNGAADKAGLESGDVIRKIGSEPISSKSSFEEVINAMSPGDDIRVQYERNRRLYETNLTLENILGNTDILSSDNSLDEDDIYFSGYLGAEFRALTESERESLRLRYGVKVSKIDKEKGFFRKLDDIEEGDIIVAVNRKYANNPEALANYIEQYYGRIYFEIVDKNGRQRTETYRFSR